MSYLFKKIKKIKKSVQKHFFTQTNYTSVAADAADYLMNLQNSGNTHLKRWSVGF